MKRTIVAAMVAGSLMLSVSTARADNVNEPKYEDSIMHPLRIAGFMAYPIGFVAEWLIGRPLHFIVSRPDIAPVSGYQSIEDQGQFKGRSF